MRFSTTRRIPARMHSFAPPGALIRERSYRGVFYVTLAATFAVSLMLALHFG